MKPCIALAFGFLWILVAASSRADIGIGDSREEVLRQLGKPTSTARRGGHEIFLFPGGGRVELVDGKVADVKGPLPSPVAPATEPPSPIASPPTATPTTPKAMTPATVAPSPPISPAPALAPSEDYNPAVAANELAKHVEKMDTAWGMAPPQQTVHSKLESLPELLTGLALRFVFTIIALKLAFKYWEMDAFWKGVFMIAGIDTVVHAILELLGPATGGLSNVVAVENGIAGLVLIYTINRFCFNKRIQNAVLTAAAVKLVVTLCYMFAGVAMLNMVYG